MYFYDTLSYDMSDELIISCAATKETELIEIMEYAPSEKPRFELNLKEFQKITSADDPTAKWRQSNLAYGYKPVESSALHKIIFERDPELFIKCKRELNYRLFASFDVPDKKDIAMCMKNGITKAEEISLQKALTISDPFSHVTILKKESEGYTPVPSRRIVCSIPYPFVYFCKGTGETNLSLNLLSCDEEADICAYHQIGDTFRKISITDKGKMATNCPYFMAKLLRDNQSFNSYNENKTAKNSALLATAIINAAHLLNLSVKHRSLDFDSITLRSFQKIKSAKNNPEVACVIKEVSEYVDDFRKYVQKTIDEHSGEIVVNILRTMKIRQKNLGGESKINPAIVETGEETVKPVFADDYLKTFLDILELVPVVFPNDEYKLPHFSLNLPIKTKDEVLNRIQSIEVQKVLLKGEYPVRMNLVPIKYITGYITF